MKIKHINKEIYIYSYLYYNKNCSIIQISKSLNITYAHTFKIIKYANDKGILNINIKGRRAFIKVNLKYLPYIEACYRLEQEFKKFKRGLKNE